MHLNSPGDLFYFSRYAVLLDYNGKIKDHHLAMWVEGTFVHAIHDTIHARVNVVDTATAHARLRLGRVKGTVIKTVHDAICVRVSVWDTTTTIARLDLVGVTGAFVVAIIHGIQVRVVVDIAPSQDSARVLVTTQTRQTVCVCLAPTK